MGLIRAKVSRRQVLDAAAKPVSFQNPAAAQAHPRPNSLARSFCTHLQRLYVGWSLRNDETRSGVLTVEPVFGIIKQVLGFRQFSLRGLEAVSGEWRPVAMAFNLKRMHVLAEAR
jgi:hypothetical protein